MIEVSAESIENEVGTQQEVAMVTDTAGTHGDSSILAINGNFILVFLNILILYFFLNKFLFKKVTVFMEKREKTIKDDLENASLTKEEAEAMKSKYEAQLRQAQIEIEKVLVDAQVKAGKKYDNILIEARKEVDRLKKEAKEDIENERQKMIREVKGHIANLAIQAASKIIEKNMDNESNKDLVNKFLEEEGAA